MDKVVFKSNKRYLQVAHENLFHCGCISIPTKPGTIEPDYDKARELGIPVPEKLNSGYCFAEGEEHNLLTLETEEEIKAMREYLKGNKYIVELDGNMNEPEDPKGAVVYVIVRGSKDYTTHSTALAGRTDIKPNRVYNFVGGKYVTADEAEIKKLDAYIKSTSCPVFESA